MTAENVASFRSFVDAWNRGDVEAWVAGLDAEVELHPSAAAVEGGAYRGHQGVRRFWADIGTAFEEMTTSFDEVQDLGDMVLGLGRLRAQSKAGIPVDLEYGLLVRYRDGLIVWGRSWFSHAEARAAAGSRAGA